MMRGGRIGAGTVARAPRQSDGHDDIGKVCVQEACAY